MSNTLYDQSVATFAATLRAVAGLLDKARGHAQSAGYDVDVLAQARLFPDMFPLARQVQLATDFAKGGAARLAGVEVPKWEDSERTLDELSARLAKAQAFLAGFTPAQFEGAGARTIELKTPARTFTFQGDEFLLRWALPNFYFHCTTAYNLLRHNGVPVGKLEFLGLA